MVLDLDLDLATRWAQRYTPKQRRWATPGAMARDLDPTTAQTPVLDAIDTALVDLADGDTTKLMVFVPPQEGKSQRVSRRFPLWLLEHNPRLRIVIVSYDQEHATRWGRDIRRDVQNHPELGVQLRADSKAAGRWHTAQGGSVYCTGIAGAFTGQPADLLIVDDPVKDRRAAESKAERDAAWDWWENVASVRARRTVLMMTRWHADDLAGRLKEREPGLWRELSIPAVAGDRVETRRPDGSITVRWEPTSEPDPLGRRPGEELPSVHDRTVRPAGYFHALADRMSGYVFRSLYQQRPTAARGSMFARDRWRYWTHLGPDRIDLDGRLVDLRDCWRYGTVDLAASTRTGSDWTVAAMWALTGDRELVLLGRVRERTAEADHWGLVKPLAQRWRVTEIGVESAMIGTTLVRSATQAGLAPFDLRADTDKVTRAIPYAHLVKQGRVWLPSGEPWLDEWIGEHADFPTGAHDDQVDVGSYAARLAVGEWHPGGDQLPDANPAVPPGEIDFMTVPL